MNFEKEAEKILFVCFHARHRGNVWNCCKKDVIKKIECPRICPLYGKDFIESIGTKVPCGKATCFDCNDWPCNYYKDGGK